MAKKTKETAATPAPEKPQVDEKVEKLKVKKPKTKKFEKPSDGVTKVNLKELAKKAEDVVKVDTTKTVEEIKVPEEPQEEQKEVKTKEVENQDTPVLEEVTEQTKIEKPTPVKKPDVVLLHKLRSIPASNTVNSILFELVATVNKPVSPDLIPLNTIWFLFVSVALVYIVSELVPAVDTSGNNVCSFNFLAAFVLELATSKKSVAATLVFERVLSDVISAILLYYFKSIILNLILRLLHHMMIDLLNLIDLRYSQMKLLLELCHFLL